MRKVLVSSLIYALTMAPVVQAAPIGGDQDLSEFSRVTGNKDLIQRGSVFIYGDQALDSLIPVRIIGAVGKPGLHYVPVDTELVTLISVAGGVGADAEVDSVTIKRNAGQKDEQVFKINLEDVVGELNVKSPTLQANDTVFIPTRHMLVSDNLSRTVGLVVGIASILVSAVVITRAK